MISPRYYVLRDDMLAYYLDDLAARLSNKDEIGGWEVSTTDFLDMDNAILRRFRRSRQRSIA